MSSSTYLPVDAEIIVLGGGPAGATAARLLASWGRRVLVLARAGTRHALAESLPPSCCRTLERLGLGGAIDRAGFVRSTGNTVWWALGEPRVERFALGTAGLQVGRGAFDRLLLGEAELAGARIRRAVVRDVDRLADGTWRVGAETDDGPLEVAARWVLDCSGRGGVLARRGWRRSESARTLAMVGVWERDGPWDVPDPSHTLVESSVHGWAWSVPESPARRFVTMMVDPASLGPEAQGAFAASYARALARSPRHARLVRGARLVAPPWARDASPYGCSRRGDGGVLLVGDAASFVDPLSSFGVKKALTSARLAAVIAHSALDDPSLAEAALSMFDSREAAMCERLARDVHVLASTATVAHGGAFWAARAPLDTGVASSATRPPAEAAVRAAFEAIRTSAALALQLTDSVQRGRVAAVHGNRVVMEACLVAPGLPDGLRWWGNVDTLILADLAPIHHSVPALWSSYNAAASARDAPEVSIPELLGTLAMMVGRNVLALA